MKKTALLFVIVSFLISSCAKDNSPAYNTGVLSGLSVEFDNIAGSSDLELNTGTYTNATGEAFTVSKLRYYVSNFILTATTGEVYTVPQDSCYFLIDESDESTHEPELRVPEGEYKTISFLVGVDSVRSADISGHTGVLDPAFDGGDMYWGLDSGYIFFNMEGSSPATGMAGFQYHIGGYGASTVPVINNIRRVTLDLSARGVPKVKTGTDPNIHLLVDILEVFNGPAQVSIAEHPKVGFEDFSTSISNNYGGMFRHDHTEN